MDYNFTPATEDLMREHGLLNRILIIYDRYIINPFDNKLLHQVASIVKLFIEEYHERLEEAYIFTLFGPDHEHRPLIDELINQHTISRGITTAVIELSKKTDDIQNIRVLLDSFVHMYRAHESREDTVIFPAVRKMIDVVKYNELTKMFEETEEKLLGAHGYEKVLATIMEIEKKLNLYDLAGYNPC